MLLPLALAPSQWESLVPLLNRHYCTITVGGPFVGSVASLEGRLISGYGDVVQRLVEVTLPCTILEEGDANKMLLAISI